MEEDYCPNCGRWVAVIHHNTGWCTECSQIYHPDLLYCKRCGDPYNRNKNGLYCSACKDRNWIEQHIDAVEVYVSIGYTWARAKEQVAEDIRPVCLCCGYKIRGGPRDAKFCGKSPCRRAKDQYDLLTSKGVPHDVALAVMGLGDTTIIRAA